MNFKIFFLFSLLLLTNCNVQEKNIYTNVLRNSEHWIVEQQIGGKVIVENNSLEIVDVKGCTVWFKNKLFGNIKIEYDVTVIDKGGLYDRVSDMNCFWMANDPNSPDDFFKNSKQRMGFFPNYHNLKLYYVGYGGHNNTKTRFRRYNGNIERPLLAEHDLSDIKYRISSNKKMHIEIFVDGTITKYVRDGEVIFEVNDLKPYLNGYFGFRTVNNHMLIENFKIKKRKPYKLQQ